MDRAAIAEVLLTVGALELRTREPFFTFASGIRSPVYTDNRLLIGDAIARRRVRDAFAARITALGLAPDVIAGTATAGIPHAAFLAEALDLPMVYVRGGAKGHGKGKQIEGGLVPGRNVLLLEDLISTGGSSLAAAEALRDAGANVIGVLAIFSYGFPAVERAFEEAGFRLSPLVTFADVLQLGRDRGEIGTEEAALLARWSRDPQRWPASGHAADMAPARPLESLVIAADLTERAAVEQLARNVAGIAGYLKLNSAFVAHGPALVASIRRMGLSVFLDLKFHDIPNTAANHVREAACMGVGLLTVHACGGPTMIRACADAAREQKGDSRPRVLAVTALTSLSNADLASSGVPDGREAQVLRLARLARDSGADGVVCSVAEAPAVRAACGEDFLIVTPGVRPANSSVDDHARTATPRAALAAGADYIVVGRPVYKASDPTAATRAIAADLAPGS